MQDHAGKIQLQKNVTANSSYGVDRETMSWNAEVCFSRITKKKKNTFLFNFLTATINKHYFTVTFFCFHFVYMHRADAVTHLEVIWLPVVSTEGRCKHSNI